MLLLLQLNRRVVIRVVMIRMLMGVIKMVMWLMMGVMMLFLVVLLILLLMLLLLLLLMMMMIMMMMLLLSKHFHLLPKSVTPFLFKGAPAPIEWPPCSSSALIYSQVNRIVTSCTRLHILHTLIIHTHPHTYTLSHIHLPFHSLTLHAHHRPLSILRSTITSHSHALVYTSYTPSSYIPSHIRTLTHILNLPLKNPSMLVIGPYLFSGQP